MGAAIVGTRVRCLNSQSAPTICIGSTATSLSLLMTDHIRAKLEALISDSGMFNAGQTEERLRVCALIDSRLEELADLRSHPHISARREELLIIRQLLKP